MTRKMIALAAALVMVVGLAGGVLASPWDMWKGEFITTNPAVAEDYPDAGGRVILNYDKELGSYMVNVQVYGLKPGQEYNVLIQTGAWGTMDYRATLGFFVAEENGRGRLKLTDVSPTVLILDGTSPRVIVWEAPGSWVLNTSNAEEDTLQPVGSNRGE